MPDGQGMRDACFLIGLYDKDDQYHANAVRQFEFLFGEQSKGNQLVVPWPILYECSASRHARDRRKLVLFSQRWSYLYNNAQLELLDDGKFRERCLAEYLELQPRVLSFADRILRAMIESERRYFDYVLTYNTGDFADACQDSAIVLMNEYTSPDSYGI